MFGYISILTILGSTMLVNAAPPSQGLRAFARDMRDPNCTNNTGIIPYNPYNLGPQKLNNFYLNSQLNISTCDSSSIDLCTRGCSGSLIDSCVDDEWVSISCDKGESCYAVPITSNRSGIHDSLIGCYSSEVVDALFEKFGYIDGPFGPMPSSGVCSTLNLNHSSTVHGSMSTPIPLSSTTNVLSSSMSSPASLPSLTGSGGLNRRYRTPTITHSSNPHSSLTFTPSSVNPCPSSYPESGLDFTPTSTSELGDPTDSSELDPPTMSCPPMSSDFSDSFSTGSHTSMSSDPCDSQPTPLPSSSTSIRTMKSPPVHLSVTSMPFNNSGLPLSTSPDHWK